jgi:GNAT superfamily N-acetyltransferase
MIRQPTGTAPGAWTIRHAQLNERQAIEAHLTETWLATYAALVGREPVEQMLTDMRDADDLVTFLCSADAELLIAATASGDIRGTVAVGMSSHTAFITAMYVRPSDQGCGLGRALLETALESTPPDRPVALAVLALRPQIIAFYQRFGFEPRGTGTYQVGTTTCDTIELVRPPELTRP